MIFKGKREVKNIKNDGHGARLIKTILSFKRVFIVLDDVDNQNQLEYLIGSRELLGKWLGKRSRVIITKRDKRLWRSFYTIHFLCL